MEFHITNHPLLPDLQKLVESCFRVLSSSHTNLDKIMASSSARSFPTIKAIRSYVIDGVGSGGDYHNVKGGHW